MEDGEWEEMGWWEGVEGGSVGVRAVGQWVLVVGWVWAVVWGGSGGQDKGRV